MPKIRNRLFQPLGIMLANGTMLHVRSREECDVSEADLDSAHLQGLMASGQLALATGDRQAIAAPAHDSAVEPERTAPTDAGPEQVAESRRAEERKDDFGPRHEDETE
jgi:hypothetical protein